jgi:alcohol dehydrogenase, propanol-preferring
VSGWETLCESQQNTGYSIDGGHAEYAVADAAFAVPVPDGVDPLDAAPLTCAGVTTYKAVKVSGASVVAVDVDENKLALARRLGASHTVNAAAENPAARIQDLGGADVAIALAVAPGSVEKAVASPRRGGRLVLVSLPKDGTLRIPIFDTVLKGVQVIGSIVGTRNDLAEVFALHAAGRTRVVAEERKLEEVNGAFEEILSGQVPARLVIRP